MFARKPAGRQAEATPALAAAAASRLSAYAAIVLASIALSLLDVGLIAHRSPGAGAPLPIMALTLLAEVGVTVALALPLLALRFELHRLGGRWWWSRAAIGAAEGLLLGWLAAYLEKHAAVTDGQRLVALAVVSVGLAASYALAPYLPRLRRPAMAAALVGALALSLWLSWREKLWLRLAVDAIALAALADLLVPLASRGPRRARTTLVVCGIALAGAAIPSLRHSPRTRSVFFDYAAHGQAFMAPILRFAPRLFHKPNALLGVQPCPAKREIKRGGQRCIAPPRGVAAAPKAERLAGQAAGADVVFLVVDALRWDHVDRLEKTLAELGPHIRFTTAVTPAPATKHAVAAMMRGTPARQVPFGVGVLHGGVSRGASATLGAFLAEHGYRSVNVPTMWFFDPEVGVNTGFEVVRPDGEVVFWPRGGPKPRRVWAKSALATMLEVARSTPGPVLLWTHLLEPHDPYVHDSGRGPDSIEGYRAALRDLDPKIAAFIRDLRSARAGRPVIFVLAGDHGEEFGEHGGRYHGLTVHAENARVGFVLAAPDLVTATTEIDAPVSISAAATTVLELLGIPAPCSFTVPSLLACIERGDGCPDIAETQMVRKGRWIGSTTETYRALYDPSKDVLKVFDLRGDPYERRDLWGDLTATERKKLRRTLREYANEYCVPREIRRARRTPPPPP